MANFNAMFAGCESFMEGDVEINNDVTVPTNEGDALEAETTAEDVGTEGGELVGEAETTDTKAEAANLVFDQLLNMYRHVKENGIDRTFLSLYNNNGQLNNMINYRFPSCESMDSVGSPRSSVSRAFIAAMEDDGIFARIWNWIKEQWVKLCDFFRKVISWFREACGNLDLRVGKLMKYFSNAEDRPEEEIKDKSVKYISKEQLNKYVESSKKVEKEINALLGSVKTTKVGTDQSIGSWIKNVVTSFFLGSATTTAASIATGLAASFGNLNKNLSNQAGNTKGYGSERDKSDTDGAQQIKKYIDKFTKEGLDPCSDAIGKLGNESAAFSEVKSKGTNFIDHNGGEINISGNRVCDSAKKVLGDLQSVLKDVLTGKQALDSLERANDQARQRAEQDVMHQTGSMMTHEQATTSKDVTAACIKAESLVAKSLQLQEKYVAKICKVVSSYQSLVNTKS